MCVKEKSTHPPRTRTWAGLKWALNERLRDNVEDPWEWAESDPSESVPSGFDSATAAQHVDIVEISVVEREKERGSESGAWGQFRFGGAAPVDTDRKG